MRFIDSGISMLLNVNYILVVNAKLDFITVISHRCTVALNSQKSNLKIFRDIISRSSFKNLYFKNSNESRLQFLSSYFHQCLNNLILVFWFSDCYVCINIFLCLVNQNLHRGCLHETRNEISAHHKRNSVYITFHCGQIKMNFISGVVRDKRPIK